MIYFVQPVDGGPVKIGHSVNVDARRKSLETVYGKPLALLGTLPGGRDEERAIHEKFSHLRLGRTEQFKPAPELMGFIGRPLLVCPNPDAVAVSPKRLTQVGLDMTPADHERLQTQARKHGLTMAACARMAVLKWLEAQEAGR